MKDEIFQAHGLSKSRVGAKTRKAVPDFEAPALLQLASIGFRCEKVCLPRKAHSEPQSLPELSSFIQEPALFTRQRTARRSLVQCTCALQLVFRFSLQNHSGI